ncbi:hypothetical protein [Leptolyngbya sp. FACHB-261]|uniref:hypothetical protein n=1 Tax=Leptolyngbya sp. FACHB-261 TaxID=2692806 RepID=UPI001683D355|nr:hypothetical protein [Leptolyngbya sp. FACHB-261]MBD2103862.1 hypothetical protein [Leptolyngbya sp. FACHB-261]
MTLHPKVNPTRRYQLACEQMPLAVYREVAAHLQQVRGVQTELIWQQSQTFDYQQSQIGGLWIEQPVDLDATEQRYLETILAFYQERYGLWVTKDPA